jgi:putative DNA primase/helicase
MSPRPDDLPAIRFALAERLEVLACLMLGDPVVRKGHVWRWGKKGSLAVVMQGPKRGGWNDHEAGQGGGPLDLIMLGKRLNIADAIAAETE